MVELEMFALTQSQLDHWQTKLHNMGVPKSVWVMHIVHNVIPAYRLAKHACYEGMSAGNIETLAQKLRNGYQKR